MLRAGTWHARPGRIPAVDDERRDVAVVREKLLELRLDELRVLGLDVSGADAVVGVEDAEVEHDGKPFLTESIDILADDIDVGGRLHGVVVGGLRIPDAEAAVVLGGEAAVGHAGSLGGLCPLAAVEARRCEGRDGHVGIGPVLNGIRGHVVVDEHTEAEIDEGLLQFTQ